MRLPTIDATITATLRPEVIKLTLHSFFEHMFTQYIASGGTIRFIVNVDPVGAPEGFENEKFEQTINTIYQSIPDNACGSGVCVVINTPFAAHFTKAFKWAWGEAKAHYVFHLEDDWQLLRPVNLVDMITLMDLESDLTALRLSFFTADTDRLKNWNRFFPWRDVPGSALGGYFRCPPELIPTCGMCGHPSLIRGDFVRKAAKLIDVAYNPEKQFHYWNTSLVNLTNAGQYGVYATPKSKPIIRDLGRTWLRENGYEKIGIKAFFMEWGQKNEH